MAPPRKIVLEQQSSHASFHYAQFVILCIAMVTAAVYVIVSAMNDKHNGDVEITSDDFFKTTVALSVIGMTILFINYYKSSSRTLYVLKILCHLAGVGLVITAATELTRFKSDLGGAIDAEDSTCLTFGGLTIALVGIGVLLGIVNAAHEFSFLF